MLRVLTIAGSDPSGGAGMQVDLKVFADLGVYGLSAITNVTAQNSQGVQKINVVPPTVIRAQIDSVVRDIGVDACKVGMLYSPHTVSTVAERIARREIANVVVDPLVFAKDGSRLLSEQGVKRLRKELLPKTLIVTPNLADAEALSGRPVKNVDEMREAARAIFDMGSKFVLVKGGHLEGDPVDVLYDGGGFVELPGKRIAGTPMRGTGCIMSSAIAARLALGDNVAEACVFAKAYVEECIRRAVVLGKGKLLFFPG